MIRSESLRNKLLALGLKHYVENIASNAVVSDGVLFALGTELETRLPQQLAAFRAMMEAPGAEERANFELLTRTVDVLEGKMEDYKLIRSAVQHRVSAM